MDLVQMGVSTVLLGDIGGTNARFALVHGEHQPIVQERILSTGDYPDLLAAAQAYLQEAGQPVIRRACVAIANPIDGICCSRVCSARRNAGLP